jgi:hypothetical protein
VVTALSNLCLTIPAGATYQLGFSATTLQYMTLTSGAGINTFSGGGVNLTTGDGIGWGGTAYPATPANYPRGFIGGITFVTTTAGTAPSVPVLSAVNGQICSGNSTTLSIASGNLNSATAWKWYNTSCGTGSAGTGTSIVVSPVATTTYYARGEGGCGYTMTSCATLSVVVNPLPAVTVNSGSVCAGDSFTMIPGGATTYTYSSGSPIVAPTSNTTYVVSGTDANGCINTATSSVAVNLLPVISVNSGSICAGSSFTMTPTGANTYTYSNGSATATPTITSSYTVTGTDINGCYASAVSNVTVQTVPLTVNTSNTLICVGQTATLSASGAATYTWNSTQATSSIAVSPTTTTTYTIDAEDANGCVTTSTISQNVSACTFVDQITNSRETITIYPNPFNNKITVLNAATGKTIQVFNCLGASIYTAVIESEKTEIDLNRQPSGVYFIKTGLTTIKIIKE